MMTNRISKRHFLFRLGMAALAGLPLTLAGMAARGDDVPIPDPVVVTPQGHGRDAFSLPFLSLPSIQLPTFLKGRNLFRQSWVVAPAEDAHIDGLGPTYNRLSCAGCHLRNGRGAPPETPEAPMRTMLVRLSVPAAAASGPPQPHPAYGDQFNPEGIPGVPGEGRASVVWHEHTELLAGGEAITLRRPEIRFPVLRFGAIGPETLLSPRVAPPVFGLGLLEAVPESTLAAGADPDDRDGDGISGRLNRVPNAATGREMVGRFGWKAGAPSLEHQIAAAFLGDMGLTTALFPTENCPAPQTACQAAPHGGGPTAEPEVSAAQLAALTFYHRLLAVPAARPPEPSSAEAFGSDSQLRERGRAVFAAAGCPACHRPALHTGPDAPTPQLAERTFFPYTDLLLHDMGPELADNRPEFQATGQEWRTPPLWGLGWIGPVNDHSTLLHDGRARSVLEAVLWHGGEGAAARDAVRALSPADRAALQAFVLSL